MCCHYLFCAKNLTLYCRTRDPLRQPFGVCKGPSYALFYFMFTVDYESGILMQGLLSLGYIKRNSLRKLRKTARDFARKRWGYPLQGQYCFHCTTLPSLISHCPREVTDTQTLTTEVQLTSNPEGS